MEPMTVRQMRAAISDLQDHAAVFVMSPWGEKLALAPHGRLDGEGLVLNVLPSFPQVRAEPAKAKPVGQTPS